MILHVRKPIPALARWIDKLWICEDYQDWVKPDIDLALSSGYYDQPHMVREFRKYANMTPTELYHRQDMIDYHVPL